MESAQKKKLSVALPEDGREISLRDIRETREKSEKEKLSLFQGIPVQNGEFSFKNSTLFTMFP